MILIEECIMFTQIVENRGISKLNVNLQQNIYDLLIENSIATTDSRNGRDQINLSKRRFLQQYRYISNKKFVEERKTRDKQCYQEIKQGWRTRFEHYILNWKILVSTYHLVKFSLCVPSLLLMLLIKRFLFVCVKFA